MISIKKTKQNFLGLLLLFLFLTTSFIEAKELFTNKKIIGAEETVRLLPMDMVFKARIDTGAKTTSIDARNITLFERDGVKWVRFDCINGDKRKTLEERVIKVVKIKRHGAKSQSRYVVKMHIVLGPVSRHIEVNLNNRERFTYPVLIGRNFLRDLFIVDVVEKYCFKCDK